MLYRNESFVFKIVLSVLSTRWMVLEDISSSQVFYTFPSLPHFTTLYHITFIGGGSSFFQDIRYSTDTTRLERFWRISPHVTEDAFAKLYMWVKFSQIEGNGRKFRHICRANQ